jgi:fatty-acyl-CoA synthase
MTEVKTRAVKIRGAIITAGVVLAIFVPVWFLTAALGTKFGLWTWEVGLGKMVGGIGVPLIGLLVLVSFITSLLVVFVKPRAGFGALAAMWLITLSIAGVALNAIRTAQVLPPIHDISTDTANPLMFSSIAMAARGRESNKIISPSQASVPFNRADLTQWSGRTLVDIQAEAYPAIKPLIIEGKTPAEIYAKALSVAKAQGYRLITQDPKALRIEGYAESFWFGFKDDVVIAITPRPEGSQVDMRSVSRVGQSDLGANANRIEAYLAALQK